MRPDQKQVTIFQNLMRNKDWDGIYAWHGNNTPWITPDLLDQYVVSYIKQAEEIEAAK